MSLTQQRAREYGDLIVTRTVTGYRAFVAG
jgi:hypothetical protein